MKKMFAGLLLLGIVFFFCEIPNYSAMADDVCQAKCELKYKKCQKKCNGDTDCLLNCSDKQDDCMAGCN